MMMFLPLLFTVIAVSALIWFVLQSEKRAFTPGDTSHRCPHCGHVIQRDWLLCPYCKGDLR